MMRTDEINIRDPFVLVHEETYYLYGTRGETCWGEANGFDVYVSRDLQTWEGPHVCFHNDGTFWATRDYWAPEVYAYGGKFYMFASFKREDVCRGTAVLCADSPMGPFKEHSDGPVTPRDWECLDGTLYVDSHGKPYIVFCHEWLQVEDGEICAMPLTQDLRAGAGAPRLLFHATDAPWGTSVNGDGKSFVTDGPFMWRMATGELLCLWAGFSKGGYTQGIARSDNGEITGRFDQIEPLFDRDGGHGMLFRTIEGKLYLTLHSPNEHLKERPHFYEIEEKDGRLLRV